LSTLSNNVFEISLHKWQVAGIRPELQAAIEKREHCFFIGAAVPDFKNGELFWKFQLRRVSQKTSQKIVKLLAADAPKPAPTDAAAPMARVAP